MDIQGIYTCPSYHFYNHPFLFIQQIFVQFPICDRHSVLNFTWIFATIYVAHASSLASSMPFTIMAFRSFQCLQIQVLKGFTYLLRFGSISINVITYSINNCPVTLSPTESHLSCLEDIQNYLTTQKHSTFQTKLHCLHKLIFKAGLL